jgi:GDP-L-fucose synthase
MMLTEKVMVTGGTGFLGRILVRKLCDKGVNVIVPTFGRVEPKDVDPRAQYALEYDLTQQREVDLLLRLTQPSVIIHLAAEVGGIGANRDSPGRFFYSNLMMGMNLIEVARYQGVKKFVQVGTICAYPKFTEVPFMEEHLWDGYPEETNAPYGIAKKALLVMLQAYRQQYGMNGIYLLPVNLYGPDDNFDLETSHVIPALIRKMEEAKAAQQTQVRCWGSGKVSREFLYVDDCADGIIMATEQYNSPEPVNLGSGEEILIRDLAYQIQETVGYTGKIFWDRSKPDGQPRRCLDTSRAKKFGWQAKTALHTGLDETIAWYRGWRNAKAYQEKQRNG